MRYALKFGYTGFDFSGYARQPHQRTVEGDIIKAFQESGMIDDLEDAQLRVASRTDSGVSALGNVLAINSEFPKDGIISNLNSYLENIWFYGIIERDAHFNPRYARLRMYRYHLFEGDLESIRETVDLFTGTHNFTNFAKIEDNDPIRTIDSIDVSSLEDLIILDFTAQSYLWNMIRRIVGAILKVEQEKIDREDIKNALSSLEKIDLGLASPYPLVLTDVIYDFDFEAYKPKLSSARKDLDSQIRNLQIKYQILKGLKNKIK